MEVRRLLRNPFISLITGLLFSFLLFAYYTFFIVSTPNLIEFNRSLNEKEELAYKTLTELISLKDNGNKIFLSKDFLNLTSQKGISFYVIKNNKLQYWTDRSTNFNPDLSDFQKTNGLVELKNGWYHYIKKEANSLHYLALIPIKYNYEIKNQYLKNKFHPSFSIDAEAIILNKSPGEGHDIKNIDGDYLFTVQLKNGLKKGSLKNNWFAITVFFAILLSFTAFLSLLIRRISFFYRFSSLIIILILVALRMVFLHYRPFSLFFNQELFSPVVFAQSALLPSLGDLLIHSVFFSIIIYFLARQIQSINSKNQIVVYTIGLYIALFPLILANLLNGLIVNSKINFDINYLLDLSAYSFIGIGCITLLFITQILFLKITINHFADNALKRYHLISIYWILSLVVVIIGHFFMDISAFLTSWILLVILTFSAPSNSRMSFYRSTFLILTISLTTSYGFIHLGKEKEQTNKEFLAKRLARERDPVAEYLFEDVRVKIENDTLIKNNISTYWENKDLVDQHILKHYFKGYFGKYDIKIFGSCKDQDTILIEPENINVNCLTFFKEKVENETNDPFNIDNNLNFLYSNEGVSSYLVKLEIEPKSVPKGTKWFLFMEWFPKVFSKTEGYPELLLNTKDKNTYINTNKYSFAKYKKGKLIDHVGKFNYRVELNPNFRFNDDGFCNTTFNSAYHVIHRSDKNSSVILSSPQKTIFNYITTFSYFFIITSILVLIIGSIFRVSPFNWQVALTDFSTKIQLFIISSIFLSFILFSWGTSYHIKKQHQEKNSSHLAEKVQSVLIELEHKLGYKSLLTPEMEDEMTYYLIKFSNVFYTDINLYDTSGTLLSTSRPEIFERGLVANRMDPKAFEEIHILKKSQFTHNENIGELKYLSTYVPFRNDRQEILAYMNLPYFAKQNELENELSSFYTSLINIYGLLFLISTIIAIFFANYISQPVRMIKNKISALQLGKSYELLDWQSNDEIGALVVEYNKKVLELEKSANLLVKSERESAWREMAKQVAHEIKNPLTPMKLSIQQLQRVAKENPDDLDMRMERTAKTLIEQIDSLTKIANEFSNFAQMPKPNEEIIDLLPIIDTAVDLYKEEKCELIVEKGGLEEMSIIADKNQISRVFNNLIKNAIQSIPENRKGIIELILNEKRDHYLIEVRDNGKGIPEDKKNKIFVPNFTTKSKGMGLGLAMVKNILENINGKIWFETIPNKGTSFFLTLTKRPKN